MEVRRGSRVAFNQGSGWTCPPGGFGGQMVVLHRVPQPGGPHLAALELLRAQQRCFLSIKRQFTK